MKCIVLRIRMCYLLDIMNGKKTIEYRRDSPYWEKTIERLENKCGIKLSQEAVAVFISGKITHRRRITQIVKMSTPGFSEQGRKDVDTPMCWAIHLGEVIRNTQEDMDVEESLKEIRQGQSKKFETAEDLIKELKT